MLFDKSLVWRSDSFAIGIIHIERSDLLFQLISQLRLNIVDRDSKLLPVKLSFGIQTKTATALDKPTP